MPNVLTNQQREKLTSGEYFAGTCTQFEDTLRLIREAEGRGIVGNKPCQQTDNGESHPNCYFCSKTPGAPLYLFLEGLTTATSSAIKTTRLGSAGVQITGICPNMVLKVDRRNTSFDTPRDASYSPVSTS